MDLRRLSTDVIECRRCARLVRCRQSAAPDHWARAVPGFGDHRARLLVLGLAPGARGANRTGRVFTGDSSGDTLFAALHRAGFANQPRSIHRDDGLALRDAYVTNIVRCVPPKNRPTAAELARCRPFLVRELELLSRLRVIVALGKVAWDGFVRFADARPRPAFGHGRTAHVGRWLLVGSYHVSQLNTSTGRVTPAMLDDVFAQARAAIGP